MSSLTRSRRRSSRRGAPQTALASVLETQGRRLVWVAQHLGVDASTVSRWCSGDRPIPERRRHQLAAILGVDPAELVDRQPGNGGATS